MSRIFLLSPAFSGGKRARLLTRPQADFALALKLRNNQASLGELFAFMSGLYFRGKLAYAERFALPPAGLPGVLVVTTNRGLLPIDTLVSLADLEAFNKVSIDVNDARYQRPLTRDIRRLAAATDSHCEVVLLGSVATGKYTEVLQGWLNERLMFPEEFIGRGDMSRGGLMLRCVAENRELTYIPVKGSLRRGRRPAKLIPIV